MTAWTTDDLVSRAKRKAQRPLRDLNFTDEDILRAADEELHTFVMPLIRTCRESYYLKRFSFPIVAGTSEYRLPSDTSAGTIRDIWLRDSANSIMKVPLISPEQRFAYLPYTNFTVPTAACLVGDMLTFLPTPNGSTTQTVDIWYEQRRSLLTAVSNCYQIRTVSDSGLVFRGTGTPPDSVLCHCGNTYGKVDIVESQPNFDLLSYGNQIVTVNSNAITLTDAVSGSKLVGSYICPEGYSCVVQLPDLFHFALVYATAATLCEEVSDFTSAAAFRAQVTERIEGLSASVEPRAVGMNPVIQNTGSPMRRGWGSGW